VIFKHDAFLNSVIIATVYFSTAVFEICKQKHVLARLATSRQTATFKVNIFAVCIDESSLIDPSINGRNPFIYNGLHSGSLHNSSNTVRGTSTFEGSSCFNYIDQPVEWSNPGNQMLPCAT
jgi:hypothetical protein